MAHPAAARAQAGAASDGDGLFALAREHCESMIGWARSGEAAGLGHEVIEERLLAGGMELVRLLFQGHLDLRAAREERRGDVVDAGGRARRTAEAGQRRSRVMIFGEVTTTRTAYRARGRDNLYPQDGELGWGPSCYSAGVAMRVARAAAVVPFARAAEQVSGQGALRLGKRQAEELAVAAAADFDGYYAARRPEPRGAGEAVLITCDGSALPVLPGALREATAAKAAARARAKEEEGWPDDPGDLRRSRKRTAELAAVADIPPAPRAPDDILLALFGPARPGKDGDARPAPGPQARGKTVIASVRRPAAAVIGDAMAEAARRDPARERPWIAVIDGNCHQIATIEALAAKQEKEVTILIDFIHVVQYLWKAAASFFEPRDPDGRDWVRDQARKILHGRHADVTAGIRRRATAFGYSTAERAGADECARYLRNKRAYLDYPAFLKAGWPVASGLIEGAARWLVKDRMEVTGARWSLDGAEAVLRLRALVGNGDFTDYWNWHLAQEHHRNHDSKYQAPPQGTRQAIALAT